MAIINRNSRLKEIISVFIKYGFGKDVKNIENPSKLRMAMEELGPTFIKLGQIISTRPDLLPKDFIIEFQKLQDNVKPQDSSVILNIIEEEFNDNIHSLFQSFNSIPVASASMAQVHRATLLNGEDVVLKIQRPYIREKMLADISILKKLSKLTSFTFHNTIIDIPSVIDELWNSANEELDFLKEASNITNFNNNNKDIKYIYCPSVYSQYTTSKVLTMEYIDGIKISNYDLLEECGYDIDDMVNKLVQNYFKQILEDGFFHGDPHPGNILISKTKIAYIDFGIMGTINKAMQNKIFNFMYSLTFKDIDAMTDSILKIGVIKGSIDKNKLTIDISEIYSKYIDTTLEDINLSQMIEDVIKICKTHGISMPRDIVILFKGVMTIEGLIASLTPKTSLFDIVVPYIKSQVFNSENIKEQLLKESKNALISLRNIINLPTSLSTLVNNINKGNMKLQMEHKHLEQPISALNKMINRVVWGLIVSAMLISSSIIVNANAGPSILGISALGLLGYLLAGFLGLWLLISIIKSGKL